jgi:hypothetical protein
MLENPGSPPQKVAFAIGVEDSRAELKKLSKRYVHSEDLFGDWAKVGTGNVASHADRQQVAEFEKQQ